MIFFISRILFLGSLLFKWAFARPLDELDTPYYCTNCYKCIVFSCSCRAGKYANYYANYWESHFYNNFPGFCGDNIASDSEMFLALKANNPIGVIWNYVYEISGADSNEDLWAVGDKSVEIGDFGDANSTVGGGENKKLINVNFGGTCPDSNEFCRCGKDVCVNQNDFIYTTFYLTNKSEPIKTGSSKNRVDVCQDDNAERMKTTAGKADMYSCFAVYHPDKLNSQANRTLNGKNTSGNGRNKLIIDYSAPGALVFASYNNITELELRSSFNMVRNWSTEPVIYIATDSGTLTIGYNKNGVGVNNTIQKVIVKDVESLSNPALSQNITANQYKFKSSVAGTRVTIMDYVFTGKDSSAIVTDSATDIKNLTVSSTTNTISIDSNAEVYNINPTIPNPETNPLTLTMRPRKSCVININPVTFDTTVKIIVTPQGDDISYTFNYAAGKNLSAEFSEIVFSNKNTVLNFGNINILKAFSLGIVKLNSAQCSLSFDQLPIGDLAVSINKIWIDNKVDIENVKITTTGTILTISQDNGVSFNKVARVGTIRLKTDATFTVATATVENIIFGADNSSNNNNNTVTNLSLSLGSSATLTAKDAMATNLVVLASADQSTNIEEVSISSIGKLHLIATNPVNVQKVLLKTNSSSAAEASPSINTVSNVLFNKNSLNCDFGIEKTSSNAFILKAEPNSKIESNECVSTLESIIFAGTASSEAMVKCILPAGSKITNVYYNEENSSNPSVRGSVYDIKYTDTEENTVSFRRDIANTRIHMNIVGTVALSTTEDTRIESLSMKNSDFSILNCDLLKLQNQGAYSLQAAKISETSYSFSFNGKVVMEKVTVKELTSNALYLDFAINSLNTTIKDLIFAKSVLNFKNAMLTNTESTNIQFSFNILKSTIAVDNQTAEFSIGEVEYGNSVEMYSLDIISKTTVSIAVFKYNTFVTLNEQVINIIPMELEAKEQYGEGDENNILGTTTTYSLSTAKRFINTTGQISIASIILQDEASSDKSFEITSEEAISVENLTYGSVATLSSITVPKSAAANKVIFARSDADRRYIEIQIANDETAIGAVTASRNIKLSTIKFKRASESETCQAKLLFDSKSISFLQQAAISGNEESLAIATIDNASFNNKILAEGVEIDLLSTEFVIEADPVDESSFALEGFNNNARFKSLRDIQSDVNGQASNYILTLRGNSETGLTFYTVVNLHEYISTLASFSTSVPVVFQKSESSVQSIYTIAEDRPLVIEDITIRNPSSPVQSSATQVQNTEFTVAGNFTINTLSYTLDNSGISVSMAGVSSAVAENPGAQLTIEKGAVLSVTDDKKCQLTFKGENLHGTIDNLVMNAAAEIEISTDLIAKMSLKSSSFSLNSRLSIHTQSATGAVVFVQNETIDTTFSTGVKGVAKLVNNKGVAAYTHSTVTGPNTITVDSLDGIAIKKTANGVTVSELDNLSLYLVKGTDTGSEASEVITFNNVLFSSLNTRVRSYIATADNGNTTSNNIEFYQEGTTDIAPITIDSIDATFANNLSVNKVDGNPEFSFTINEIICSANNFEFNSSIDTTIKRIAEQEQTLPKNK